jgi:hypothetical protein
LMGKCEKVEGSFSISDCLGELSLIKCLLG